MIKSLKILILIASLLAADVASASVYGFGFLSLTGDTGIGGTVTVSIQIPGTFGGIIPNDPTAARYLKSAMIWADTPAAGDQLTLFQIVDTDGVIPVQARAAFANYPVIFDLLDSATGGTKALFIPSNGITTEAFDQTGAPTVRLLPSQLYLKITYQAGGLGIGKTFRTVLRWGIWQ